MEEKLSRLERWSKNERAPPYSIEYHPTNLCNLKCIMCGTRAEHRRLKSFDKNFDPARDAKFELTEEEVMNLIKDSANLGVREWLITGGGEPFVKEYMIRVMQEIKNNGIFGNLNTNGVLLDKQKISNIVEMKWDMIMFSIDSHESSVHDSIRGVPGTFSKVDQTLKTIKNIKSKKQTSTPKIVFNTVLTNKIYNKIDKFLEYAANVGCEDITFNPLMVFDADSKKLELSPIQENSFQGFIGRLVYLSKKLGINTNLESLRIRKNRRSDEMDKVIMENISESDNDFSTIPCFKPYLNVLIKMNGLISPCCMVENYRYNIREMSLEEIWYGPYFTNLRKSMKQRKLIKECSKCVFSQIMHNIELRNQLKKRIQ